MRRRSIAKGTPNASERTAKMDRVLVAALDFVLLAALRCCPIHRKSQLYIDSELPNWLWWWILLILLRCCDMLLRLGHRHLYGTRGALGPQRVLQCLEHNHVCYDDHIVHRNERYRLILLVPVDVHINGVGGLHRRHRQPRQRIVRCHFGQIGLGGPLTTHVCFGSRVLLTTQPHAYWHTMWAKCFLRIRQRMRLQGGHVRDRDDLHR